MTKRYTSKELRGMSLKSLEQVGKSLGLQFSKNHTKAERTKRILAAYLSEDSLAEEKEEASQRNPPSGQPDNLHEPNPEFERLCQVDTAPSVDGDVKMDGRGGAREEAGRPEGMTNELARYNRLPQSPHPAIQHCLELLFEAWATRARCPEVALTKDQAFALALPYTQAAYLAGVLDYIPIWAIVAIELVWNTWSMINAKASLARDAAAKRKEVESKEVQAND